MTVDELAALIGKDTRLKKIGKDKHLGSCPLHADSRPSLSIFEGKDGKPRWHCFSGCGGGDAADWIMRTQGKTFKEAVAALGERATPNPEIMKARAERYWREEGLREFRDKHVDSTIPEWGIDTTSVAAKPRLKLR